MNPILMLARNNRFLTRRAVASALHQDIPVNLMVIDDGSSDGTSEMLEAIAEKHENMLVIHAQNRGVTKNWNLGLNCFFSQGCEHVMVVNNDLVLPKNIYRLLLSVEGGMVSGISVNEMSQIGQDHVGNLSQHPDFSCILIRRDTWKKVGEFDDRYMFYAQDLDYHIRMHRAGVKAVNSGVPFYHERSSTLKNASPQDHERYCKQADIDRAVFKSVYGFDVWSPEYGKVFEDEGNTAH